MRYLAILLCALLLGFAAPAAYAEDTPVDGETPSAVEQLKPEELEAIKKRLPKSWTEYSAEQQERIARGMLRLRNMTPEQQAKLKRRMDEALAAKKAGVNLDKKFADMRANRRHYDAAWKIGKGTGQLIRESLGDETRQKLSALPVRVHGRHLDMAFSRMFLDTVIKGAQGGVMQIDAGTLPEPVRKQFEAKRQKLASLSPEKAERYKRHLAHILVTGEVMQLIEGVERPARVSREQLRALDDAERKAHVRAYEAYFRTIGEKAQQRWPAAFDATVTSIRELADDPDKIGRIITKHARGGRDGRSRMGGSNPVVQLLLLERQIKGLPNEAALRGHIHALVRGLLVEKAKVDPQAVDKALALEGRERSAALMKLSRALGAGRGMGRPGRGGGRGARPGGDRKRDGAQGEGDKDK